MTEPCERALARAAGRVAVKQAYTAVRAEVDFFVLQVDRALAARAHVLGQARQGHVVAQYIAALCLEPFANRRLQHVGRLLRRCGGGVACIKLGCCWPARAT